MNQWGEDVYLELAEAAVEHGKEAELDRISQEWFGSRENAISAAEAQVPSLDGPAKVRMQRHIASLKAWVTRKSQKSQRPATGSGGSAPKEVLGEMNQQLDRYQHDVTRELVEHAREYDANHRSKRGHDESAQGKPR
jgi:hypothetical protein